MNEFELSKNHRKYFNPPSLKTKTKKRRLQQSITSEPHAVGNLSPPTKRAYRKLTKISSQAPTITTEIGKIRYKYTNTFKYHGYYDEEIIIIQSSATGGNDHRCQYQDGNIKIFP